MWVPTSLSRESAGAQRPRAAALAVSQIGSSRRDSISVTMTGGSFANLHGVPFTSWSRRIIMTNRDSAVQSQSRRSYGVVNALRRLLGTGVLATAMMLPAAMAQHSGHHGNGSLAHHVSGRALGAGSCRRSGIGVGAGCRRLGVRGWGFGYWLPYYAMGVPGGVFTFVPPMLPMGPGGFVPMMAPPAAGSRQGPDRPTTSGRTG